MSRRRSSAKAGKPLRSVLQWHRWFGLGAALFAVVLSITGLMLNHTQVLRLDERRVNFPWMSQLYGINPPPLVTAYQVQNHWISQWGDRLFLNAGPVNATGSLRGATNSAGMIIAAGNDQILLLSPRGELVERLPLPGLRAVGKSDAALVVRTEEGLLLADEQLIGWSPLPEQTEVTWSDSAPLPDALRRDIQHALRGEGLPLERIVLDLHSGRILGSAGVWLMDAAAAALVFSAVSGVWLRMRRRLRRLWPRT